MITSPSRFQAAIFEHAQNIVEAGAPNLAVEAVAGSGKSSTLIEICNRLPRGTRATVVAFGADIAAHMGKQLPTGRGHQALTAHALCRRAWLRRLGQGDITVDRDKIRGMLATAVQAGRLDPKATPPGQIRMLVDAARGRGLVPEGTPGMTGLVADTEREWAGLMADLDIEPRDPNALLGAARRALKVSIAQSGGTIDFQDMLYMPILTDGTVFPGSDLAMVDELQDLDPLQRRMVEMVGVSSRGFIGVGDPRQAIFSWRGTGLDAMERVAETMACASLPLSVCYRCPTSHLDLAREFVPQIEAAPSAVRGLVEHHQTIDLQRFAPGDVVICRMKAPCVDLAIRLIQAGIPTRVLGRDIASSVEELVRSSGAESVTALVGAARKRCDRAQARAAKLDDDRALAEAADRQRIVEAIADTCDDDSIETFIRRLRFLFSEEDPAGKVTLCSIHKFKGMQAARVWWLDEHPCDDSRCKSPMMAQETRNLRYVALTRSTSELHFVYSKDK